MPAKKKMPSLAELKKKMDEKGIPHYGKTRAQMLQDVAEEGDGVFIIDRALNFSREQLLDFERKNQQVPGKTIAWEKDREIIEEYLAYNSMAFNNCDLTDTKANSRHIFGSKDVKCDCGCKFRIERRYMKKNVDLMVEVVEPTVLRLCPECKKQWTYHDMNTARAATGHMGE